MKTDKKQALYFCTQCGNEQLKWLGKCPYCQAWNSFKEVIIHKEDKNTERRDHLDASFSDNTPQKKAQSIKIREIQQQEETRIITPDAELNRVLGGGIVPGSIVLVAGEPGIGKSTLFLQNALALKGYKVLYISGEESLHQIKLRASRLQDANPEVYLFTEIATQLIFEQAKHIKADVLIIDSVQTIYSPYVEAPAGSIVQIRECTAELQRFAKKTQTPVFLIGHINKEGSIAGPKILEHIVDTVLQFEGDRNYTYRILRTLKNRFGPGTEIGIYEMKNNGLWGVDNPSNLFLSEQNDAISGAAIAAIIEGMRPILLEVQALVSPSVYGTPQRTVKGFDLRKLQLLLAVLEKRGGFQLGNKDVFVNITGGLKTDDPSLDLAVVCAIISSYEDTALPEKSCFIGEVGLNGEIRSVSRIEQRLSELQKLGFKKVFIPRNNAPRLPDNSEQLHIRAFARLEQVYQSLFN